MLTHLRVEFSDLCEYRYRHKCNCNSYECVCTTDDENNEHFLLRCPLYNRSRLILFNTITQHTNDVVITFSPPQELCNILFYGHERYKAL